jgi:hypothetical protein
MIVMKVGHARDQAIMAVLSSTVGGRAFDRLFEGASVDGIDGDVLYLSAGNSDLAAEIEDRFALHIANTAKHVLGKRVDLVVVTSRHSARAA